MQVKKILAGEWVKTTHIFHLAARTLFMLVKSLVAIYFLFTD